MQSDRRTFLLGAAASLVPASAIAQSSPSGTINLMSYGGIFQDNYVKAVVEPFQKAFRELIYISLHFHACILSNIILTCRTSRALP